MSEKGKIKKYFPDKGFGFIEYKKGDIFFHIKDISRSVDKNSVKEGMEVEFVVTEGKQGKDVAKEINIKSVTINAVSAANINSDTAPYKLPCDTRAILNQELIDSIDNFSLYLNKAAFFDPEDDKFTFYKRDKKGKEIFNKANKFRCSMHEHIHIRHKNSILRLHNCNNLKAVSFSPNWRLIVGLGNESVYETSITLHHIYGIPYVPGQAVKGVTRSWIITELFCNKENEVLKDELFCLIFGSPKNSVLGEHQGSVIFFDAYPVTIPKIEVDIMNPHFGEYYQRKDQPPADYLNPIPIPFLTVGKDTKFEFVIGDRNNIKLSDNPSLRSSKLTEGMPDDSTLLDIAYHWLKMTLTDHGIGAKTAVGYGYFK